VLLLILNKFKFSFQLLLHLGILLDFDKLLLDLTLKLLEFLQLPLTSSPSPFSVALLAQIAINNADNPLLLFLLVLLDLYQLAA